MATYKVTNKAGAPHASTRLWGRWANNRKRKDLDLQYQPQSPLPIGTIVSGTPTKYGNLVIIENPTINGKGTEYTIVTLSKGSIVYCEEVKEDVTTPLPVSNSLEERVAFLEGEIQALKSAVDSLKGNG